jgi:hypothetical protein
MALSLADNHIKRKMLPPAPYKRPALTPPPLQLPALLNLSTAKLFSFEEFSKYFASFRITGGFLNAKTSSIKEKLVSVLIDFLNNMDTEKLKIYQSPCRKCSLILWPVKNNHIMIFIPKTYTQTCCQTCFTYNEIFKTLKLVRKYDYSKNNGFFTLNPIIHTWL